ncbi:MAG: DUF6247 family protein [Acidimicrobiia bacterium]
MTRPKATAQPATPMELPPREELMPHLAVMSGENTAAFQTDLLAALYDAEASGSFEQFNRVLRSWHRSLQFLSRPGFKDKLDQAVEGSKAFSGR